jgi:hypothetical protein
MLSNRTNFDAENPPIARNQLAHWWGVPANAQRLQQTLKTYAFPLLLF